MKKSRTIIIIIGIVLFISVAGFLSYQCILPVFVNYLINASRSFPEKREPSHDGVLELRQYSKEDEDGVNSLYFYVTKKGESTPLFISDCEYRLFDFHVLKWGKGTYDIWAASGDVGTFCYLYSEEGKWIRYCSRKELKVLTPYGSLRIAVKSGKLIVKMCRKRLSIILRNGRRNEAFELQARESV